MLNDRLDKAILALVEQWGIAEKRIKRAEQVRGNEVVASAIFELRYAGRKIVDALELAIKHDVSQNQEVHDRITAFLADATEDCVKAKHDAIDSMLDFVTTRFKHIEKNLGLSKLQQFFPEFLEVTIRIHEMQDQIAESRRDRNNLRDKIYDEIEKNGYDQILGLYNRMEQSKDRVSAEIRWALIKEAALWIVTGASLIFGIWAVFK